MGNQQAGVFLDPASTTIRKEQERILCSEVGCPSYPEGEDIVCSNEKLLAIITIGLREKQVNTKGRLKNKIESNVFSYTLGAGGVKTGSKRVITLNLNRIVQDWYRSGHSIPLKDYLIPIVDRLHKYLLSWNRKLWDDFEAGILTVFSAGFISLDDEYLTCGFNGFVEAAEFLGMQNDTVYNGIRVKHDNKQYQQLAKDILGTIKDLNTKDKAEHCKFNTEMIPKMCGALAL